MAKYVTLFTCMILIVFSYGIYRENQNQQRKELNQILNDARNSLSKIENNQSYPLKYKGDNKIATEKVTYSKSIVSQ